MDARIETKLARVLKHQIRREGPLTFRDFMAHALYAPGLGFYATGPKIGTLDGTFNTNAMYPAFAVAMARAIEAAEAQLQQPLRIVECGGGTGELGRRILSALSTPHDYVVIESSPSLRKRQQALGLRSIAAPSLLAPGPSFLFGNEVLDALPVHRVMGTGDQSIQEQYVGLDENGDFCQVYQEPSSPLLQARLDQTCVTLGRGHLAEICLELDPFLAQLSAVVATGFVIFIDYGDEAMNLYHYSRPNGSLRCFYRQSEVFDPFTRVGEQDITADVDFTTVRTAAEGAGLVGAGHRPQGEWLKALGLDAMLPQHPPPKGGVDVSGLEQIMGPASLGSAFDVLGFHTVGLPPPPGFSCL